VEVFLPNIHFIVFSMCFVFLHFVAAATSLQNALHLTPPREILITNSFNSVRHTKMLYNEKTPMFFLVGRCGRPFFSPQNGWWTRFRPIATMKISSRDQDSTWAGGIVDQFDFQGDSDIKKSSP